MVLGSPELASVEAAFVYHESLSLIEAKAGSNGNREYYGLPASAVISQAR
jgi:hypothetical protein